MVRQARRVQRPRRRAPRSAMSAMTADLNGNSAQVQDAERGAGVAQCVKSISPGMMVTLSCSGSVARIGAFVS